MPNVMTLSRDRVDVALLAGRLRADLATLGAAQDVLGEDLARPLVGDAPCRSTGRRLRLVELVTALEQPDQLLEQPADLLGLLAADGDLVAAHGSRSCRERPLDLAEVLIAVARPAQT